jgi:hypothetical protein
MRRLVALQPDLPARRTLVAEELSRPVEVRELLR